MNAKSVITLEAEKVVFFSANDEAAFFEWLKKLKFVQKIEGRGSVVYISVLLDMVDEEALREILGLFRRYMINTKQLVSLRKPDLTSWFDGRKQYW